MNDIKEFYSYPMHKGKYICTVTPSWKIPRIGDTFYMFTSDEEVDDTFDNIGFKVVPVDNSVGSVDNLTAGSFNSAFFFDLVVGVLACGNNNKGLLVKADNSSIFHIACDFGNKDLMDYEMCLGSCHEVMKQVMPCCSYYQQINSRPIPIGYFIRDDYKYLTLVYGLYTVSGVSELEASFQGSKFSPCVEVFESLQDAKIEFLSEVGEQYGISKLSCGRYNLSPKDFSRGELGKDRE